MKNYGNCSPDVDYKLYVQIDGVYSVFDQTAPAGDRTKIEVLSFVYSQNGRSVKQAVDFDTSVIALPFEAETEDTSATFIHRVKR